MKEEFREVKDYEGLYEVSNLGNVKSLEKIKLHLGKYPISCKEIILKGGVGGRGYLIVKLFKDGKSSTNPVHKLVAIAFLGHTPNGYKGFVIDHVDNDSLNNKVDNLQLISQRFNATKDTKNKYSNYKGVFYNKTNNNWRGQVQIQGKQYYTKKVETEEEAYKLYKIMLNELNLVNYNEI